MTTKEKVNKLGMYCNTTRCDDCVFKDEGCANFGALSEDEVNRAYDLAFPNEAVVIDEVLPLPTIKDSGERREFDTGAVRDIQEGKGRCDLMPLDVVSEYLSNHVLRHISEFQQHGLVDFLYAAIAEIEDTDPYTIILEVAKHFEDGAKKYGEHNWQKGIPARCYIDSAIRHYLKWLRGDTDEPHDRAFVWNILCCIWTCKHKPELNDYLVHNDEK